MAAKARVAPTPIQIIGVRRSAKPSAHRARAGPTTVRANIGMARMTVISVPLSPWARNHTGMNGRLAPEPTKKAA